VQHRRTLLSVTGGYWLCVDMLDGAGPHDAEFLFHLAPGLEVESDGACVRAATPGASRALLIAGAGFEGAERRVVTGSEDPIQGWHSDDYAEKRPAPTLVTTERLRLPAVRVHLLAPEPRASPSVELTSRRVGDGLAVGITTGAGTDLLLCAPGGPRRFEVDSIDFTGELLHARMGRDGELRAFLAVHARRLAWHGEVVMEAEGVADCVAMTADRTGARWTVPASRNGHTGERACAASVV